jgi:hypothetical protein
VSRSPLDSSGLFAPPTQQVQDVMERRRPVTPVLRARRVADVNGRVGRSIDAVDARVR